MINWRIEVGGLAVEKVELILKSNNPQAVKLVIL